MPSVYDIENFSGRVNLAANYMVRGLNTTRKFDTCFEMWDGTAVAVALYRRSLNNPKLARALPKYLNMELMQEAVEKYKDIPTRKLSVLARQMREEAQTQYAS